MRKQKSKTDEVPLSSMERLEEQMKETKDFSDSVARQICELYSDVALTTGKEPLPTDDIQDKDSTDSMQQMGETAAEIYGNLTYIRDFICELRTIVGRKEK